MTSRDLWAARHPAVAVHGVCYGRTDVPLADDAGVSAARLHATFPGAARSAVWSSFSSRCATVALDLAARWGATTPRDPRLLELDFGAWEGRAWGDLERENTAAYARWMSEWQVAAPPEGETLATFRARVASWLSDRRADRDHEAPALVAHAGVIRALRVLVDGESWESAMARDVPHLAWQRFAL